MQTLVRRCIAAHSIDREDTRDRAIEQWPRATPNAKGVPLKAARRASGPPSPSIGVTWQLRRDFADRRAAAAPFKPETLRATGVSQNKTFRSP